MLPQNKNQPIQQITINKKDSVKIFKGICFLGLAALFLYVVFYDINQSYDGKPFDAFYINKFFEEYFKNTYLNYVASVLFAIIGLIEIREAFKNGN